MIKVWYFIATLILAGPAMPDGLPETRSKAYHFDSQETCERVREVFSEFSERSPEKYYRWSTSCIQVEIEKMEEEDVPEKRERRRRVVPVPGETAGLKT